MIDGYSQVEYNLVRFIHVLRHLGLPVSTSEAVDAMKALQFIPLAEKTRFKSALRATLVKDLQGSTVFDQAFHSFFVTMEQSLERRAKHAKAKAELEQQVQQAEQELTFQGHSLSLSEEDKLTYANLSPDWKNKLQEFLHKTSHGKNMDKKHEPIVAKLVKSHLEYVRRRMDLAQCPDFNWQTGDPEIDRVLEEAGAELARQQAAFIYGNLKNIREEDYPKIARLIRRLSTKLATGISRRHRQSRQVGRLDIRRSVRLNINRGGALIKLKYKRKKLLKPKLMLICDVSGSMAKYAAFMLLFIYGLTSAIKQIETFVFGERLERVTPFLRHYKSYQATVSRLTEGSLAWGEGTDMAQALASLLNNYHRLLTSSTVVIILSDTKTLRPDEAALLLERLGREVKDIIWLNTLPKADWERHPTVELFQKNSRMHECNSLFHLERILRRQLLAH
ncbi:MAG: VWA domain-containing protein [Bacillota bacterium]